LSFFDEADEPPARASRAESRGSPPSGRGGPPRGDRQAIQTRRTVAVVAIVVVVVLLALVIHSCDVSARNSALRDYTNGVAGIMQRSNSKGTALFGDLQGGNNCSGKQALHTCVVSLASSAQSDLGKAQNLSVPGQMDSAQSYLVLALKMRRDGLKLIASNVESALSADTARQAVQQIAGGTARLYGSDVVYKGYVAPEIAAALHSAGIAVGGTNGEMIAGGQIVNNLSWLQTSYVSGQIGAKVPSLHTNSTAPGLHGHSLNSVSVGSTTLSPTGTNDIPASPKPTFVLNLTNGGHFDEYNVVCDVTIAGLSDKGTTTISETTPGEVTTCSVPLKSVPTAGVYQVTAEVVPVAAEANTANNKLTFAVQFTG
jgi:hypothetical protein